VTEQHKRHIERLSQEIAEYRKAVEVAECIRQSFIRLDEKHQATPSAPEQWLRKIKRSIAFWLLG
jgi:hypothetical protein